MTIRRVPFAKMRALTTLGLGLMMSSVATAQLAMVPSPSTFDTPPEHKVGDFDVTGQVQAVLELTSNIRLDSTEESDAIRKVALSGGASSDWDRHFLSANIGITAQDVAGSAHDAQDNETLSASLMAHYQVNTSFKLIGSLAQDESIIGKGHVDELSGFKHGVSTNQTVQLGGEWAAEEWVYSVSGQWADIMNENDVEYNNEAERQSLDREEFDTTLSASKSVSWGRMYAYTGTQSVRYLASEDMGMTNRDSDGWRVGGGFEFQRGDWQSALNAIYFAQDFKTQSIENEASVVGSLSVMYRAADHYAVTASVDRSFFESNIEGSPGVYTTSYFVGLMFAPNPTSYLKIGPSFTRNHVADYVGTTERTALDLAYEWKLTSRSNLLLSVSYASQKANDPALLAQQYDVNTVSLTWTGSY